MTSARSGSGSARSWGWLGCRPARPAPRAYSDHVMKARDNDQWLQDLRAEGPQQARALDDLRAYLLRALPACLKRHGVVPEDLVEDVVQESLILTLDRLDSFEGRSQFTTWMTTIAVRATLERPVSRGAHRRWRAGASRVCRRRREPGDQNRAAGHRPRLARGPRDRTDGEAADSCRREAARYAAGGGRPAPRDQPKRGVQAHARRKEETEARTRVGGIRRCRDPRGVLLGASACPSKSNR